MMRMFEGDQIRALIIEDDYLVSEMIRGTLEELNLNVIGEASSGREGVELTQALKPDVILMDIQMPDMGGIEASRRIQACCPTPIVVLTAYETQELVEQASESGVGAYLVKPPNRAQLQRAITIAVARFQDMMELRRMNEALRARNEELDAFAHTVAHDLQNPVARIVGFAETLASSANDLPEEKLRNFLSVIARDGRRMSRIIDELLLLAGLRQLDVKPVPMDMASILEEVEERLVDSISDTQASITLPDRWPVAEGHAPWIEEVWFNYLSNAIRYGGRPPEIRLGAEVEGDGVRFWIEDNGQGISPEEQENLFQPFTRLEQVKTGGHGLGLSIVRRIVEKLGGEVGVESEVGHGSYFWFTLPAAQDAD